MSELNESDLYANDLITIQTEDFCSLDRQINAIKTLIQDQKPAAVLLIRNDYLKYIWTRCQSRNAQISRVATKDEEAALDYFKEQQYGTMETKDFECFDDITAQLSILKPPQQQAALFQQQQVQAVNNNEWQAFRDSFTSLVKGNNNLDDIAKLHYLRSSLRDEAYDQISHIELIHGNFVIAWDMLIKQYDNSVSLVNAHLNSIFFIQPLQKESPLKLKALRTSIQKHIGALKRLGRNTDGYDDILINLVESLLDPCTQRDWKLLIASKQTYPTFTELETFLIERVRLDPQQNTQQQNSQATSYKPQKPVNVKSHHTSTSANSCVICNEAHSIFKCPTFKQGGPQERFKLVKQHKLCSNCLSGSHSTNNCQSKFVCFKCQHKHHTSLHRENSLNDVSKTEQSQSQTSTSPSSGLQVVAKSHSSIAKSRPITPVLLATARVWVLAPNGRAVRVRALLDQGSTSSFVSRELVLALGAKLFKVNTTLEGLDESSLGESSRAVEIRSSAEINGKSSITTSAIVLSKITTYVTNITSPITQWAHLNNLKFADDPCNKDPIHLLIGAYLYGHILLDGLKQGNIGDPVARNTLFGWIIFGEVIKLPSLSNQAVFAYHCITNQALDNSLKKFWEIEDISIKPSLSVDDELCEAHLRQTHTHQSDGRYIVRLPFKSPLPLDIGESRRIAESMLRRNETRLAKNETVHSLYVEFMSEYCMLDHMKLKDAIPSIDSNQNLVFLPHHPVIREGSQTTKLRAVFNASSKTSNNTSLNDHMYTGPTLQNDLCILWREAPQLPIDEYCLLTGTYGTCSAPFLALRVLQQLVGDEGSPFPAT